MFLVKLFSYNLTSEPSWLKRGLLIVDDIAKPYLTILPPSADVIFILNLTVVACMFEITIGSIFGGPISVVT
jgi:hypothetical protein